MESDGIATENRLENEIFLRKVLSFSVSLSFSVPRFLSPSLSWSLSHTLVPLCLFILCRFFP